MAKVMHINKRSTFFGNMKMQCGVVLGRYEGASRNAPMCKACMRKAG